MRVGDEERYAILQKVFFGLEDLVLDDHEREDDEIDEPEFRRIVLRAHRDLSHRRDDWEGRSAGHEQRRHTDP